MCIRDRYQLYSNTTGVTETMKRNKNTAESSYIEFRKGLDSFIVDVKALEQKLKDAGVPYIKGQDEQWKED